MTLADLLAPFRKSRRASARSGLFRAVAAVWLALHVGVVAGTPVIDGAISHSEIVAHWEDAQDTSCPPQHDLEDCQLCQQITTSLADGPAMPVVPAAVQRSMAADSDEPGWVALAAALRASPDPRGPPLG